MSQASHPAVSSPAGLRHRAEIPFYLLMVALNIIILAILRFAVGLFHSRVPNAATRA